VISSIFSAYAYEESLLALSNGMLDKDVFLQLDEVAARRQRGWRPRGQMCEICRRRLWGPGTGDKVWELWQKREQARLDRRRHLEPTDPANKDAEPAGKGKAAVSPRRQESLEIENTTTEISVDEGLGPVIVFSCRHLYHQKCLGEARSEDGALQLHCPVCV
jgi:vacuolar protein sorting-associated protein 8